MAIVDIGLPDIDGIEVVKRFKQSQSKETVTKILMLTMHKSQESVLAFVHSEQILITESAILLGRMALFYI